MKTKISCDLLCNLLTSIAKSENIARFVVRGLVKNENNENLLLKRAADDFLGGLVELPSGKVDPNEDLVGALKREIKEETNLDIRTIDEYLGHFDYKSKSGTTTRQFNFKISVENVLSLKTSEEHEAAYWINEADIGNYNISEPVKALLK